MLHFVCPVHVEIDRAHIFMNGVLSEVLRLLLMLWDHWLLLHLRLDRLILRLHV